MQDHGDENSRTFPFADRPVLLCRVLSSLVDIGLMYWCISTSGFVHVRGRVLVLLRDRGQLLREQVHHLPRYEYENRCAVRNILCDIHLLPGGQSRDRVARGHLFLTYPASCKDRCNLPRVPVELSRAEQVHVQESGAGRPVIRIFSGRFREGLAEIGIFRKEKGLPIIRMPFASHIRCDRQRIPRISSKKRTRFLPCTGPLYFRQ